MKKIKKYLLLQKEDGPLIKVFKICFWLPTVYYFYYSVCVVVSLIDRLINGPSQLPISVNPEQVWLYLTGAYLVLCAVHVLLLKIVRAIKEK